MEGAYIFSPDYTQNVQGGLSFPRLLLHRPHADPNQPDEPQALLTVMDQHRLQDMDCSTDGVLTPFCNYCMKLEPVKMCRCLDEEISLDLDMIRFDLPKWVQKKDRPTSSATGERDGHVFFAPSSASNDQYWRLSQPPPPPVSYAANAPNANFDFL
ncbi:Uncharacterized protein SCF082_LOCUS32778 [Durusdinium trenchii]|uniref:Uncharacterized protein n=1 Tax=Durusdinium trenchii TaxID=1381693 RepID=A0ABP0NI33_9DINO